jgi:hypothetical protein
MGNTAEDYTATTPSAEASGWKKAKTVVTLVQASQVDKLYTLNPQILILKIESSSRDFFACVSVPPS